MYVDTYKNYSKMVFEIDLNDLCQCRYSGNYNTRKLGLRGIQLPEKNKTVVKL